MNLDNEVKVSGFLGQINEITTLNNIKKCAKFTHKTYK